MPSTDADEIIHHDVVERESNLQVVCIFVLIQNLMMTLPELLDHLPLIHLLGHSLK